MLETIEGASFQPAQAVLLRLAYDIACGALSPDKPLDNAISRKLASALIRYARLGEERLPEEIARLAVIHVRLASAPLVV